MPSGRNRRTRGVGLGGVNRRVLKRGLKAEGIKGDTLDVDATGIEAEKQSAQMTYKGYTGYMPMVGHLAENGLLIGDEFREANASPGARTLEFIKYCEPQLPRGKRIKALRADSAAYQARVINHCQEQGIGFAIGADLDEAVVRAIKAISGPEWRAYQSGHIAPPVAGLHCMNKSTQAFRLVVIRRPVQGDETAGKIVFRGRSIGLKVRRPVRGLFAEIRARSWQFANG